MEVWKDPKIIIIWIFLILLIFLILFFFIVVILRIGFKKNAEKKQIIFDQKLNFEKNLKETIFKVQDQERKEIASELHDHISNKLNLILLKLNDFEILKLNDISLIKQDLRNIITKNRDLSHFLFPIEIENNGLLLTIEDLCIKYSSFEMQISLYCDKSINFIDIHTQIQIYRIVQELLTNAIKYSEASKFEIFLRPYKDQICILIRDNGIGFNLKEVKKGLGLTGIEARLHSINAKYKMRSKTNSGTSLIILL